MKRYIKSNSERPYLYIFKHGIGPGALPKDVNIVKTKDLPNYYTAVWTDRFLTTSELKQYDIPSETRINELLSRIGYCQKNGDVVPCDEVEACGTVMASDICYRDRDNDDRVVALDAGMSDEDVEELLSEHPSYYRSALDRFEACSRIQASSDYYADLYDSEDFRDEYDEPDIANIDRWSAENWAYFLADSDYDFETLVHDFRNLRGRDVLLDYEEFLKEEGVYDAFCRFIKYDEDEDEE